MSIREGTAPVLPWSPVEVLRLAAADLRKCSEDERFVYDPQEWHSPGRDRVTGREICRVCVAGAVMAKTLGADGVSEIWGTDYADPDIKARLEMLNDVREGNFASAVALSNGLLADIQTARVRLQMHGIVGESFSVIADEVERRATILEAFLKSRGLAS